MVASMLNVGTMPALQLAGSFQSSVGPGRPTINDSESGVTLIAVAAVASVGLVSLPSCDVTETFSVSHPVKHLVGVYTKLASAVLTSPAVPDTVSDPWQFTVSVTPATGHTANAPCVTVSSTVTV